jgi:hypothetical protein
MAFVSRTTQSALRVTQPHGAIKPAWLYELLPLIYLSAGAFVTLKLSGTFAIFSGVLLMVTGVHVLRMRRENRKTTKRR